MLIIIKKKLKILLHPLWVNAPAIQYDKVERFFAFEPCWVIISYKREFCLDISIVVLIVNSNDCRGK